MLTEPRVTPTILKFVARSFKDPALKGNSGLATLAARVREKTGEQSGTDRQVVLAYFSTLGKPSTPRVKGPTRNTEPVTITGPLFLTGVSRDPEIAPWE